MLTHIGSAGTYKASVNTSNLILRDRLLQKFVVNSALFKYRASVFDTYPTLQQHKKKVFAHTV